MTELSPDFQRFGTEVFIARQPIVDRERRILAYELLFRDARDATFARVLDNVDATRELLINTFNSFGIERVLGEHRAFINISTRMLDQDLIELLPARRVVLEILEHVEPTVEVLRRCHRLRGLGYEFALDDFVYRPELEPFLEIARYVKLDIQMSGMPGVARQLYRLRRDNIVCIAEKVETQKEYRACCDLGIHYFQGYYIARPETMRARKVNAGMERLLRLFHLIIDAADPAKIEREFGHDLTLSLALLGSLEVADHGLAFKASSIQHALSMLGHGKLARCLALLLLRSSANEASMRIVIRTALVRARLTELLGHARFPQSEQDALFLCGVLSMVKPGTANSPGLSLHHLNLPHRLAAVVFRGQGPYAPYLTLSLLCEQGESERATTLARSLGFELDDILQLRRKAVAWAEKISVMEFG